MIWSRSLCNFKFVSFFILYCAILISYVQAHGGHSPDDSAAQSFHDQKFVHDEEHLKEHLQDVVKTADKMSPEEMEFNYFKLHDLDNNTKLDGLEILKAIEHALEHQTANEDKTLQPEEKKKKSEERVKQYTDIIDKVFKDDDVDNDGYLSYFEYVMARKRDDEQGKTKKK